MKSYKHFTIIEREILLILHELGLSTRKIAPDKFTSEVQQFKISPNYQISLSSLKIHLLFYFSLLLIYHLS